MTTFAYQVRDKKGKRIKGLVEAISEKMAADSLSERGYLITRITVKKKSLLLFSVSGKIPADVLTMFYFQLSNLIDSGIPLLTALETMLGQVEHPRLNKIVQKLTTGIQNGSSLSEAMDQEPGVFLMLYRSMVRVGETSGNLSKNLQYIAELNEARSEMSHQVASSLAYPVVLMVASIAVILFMVVWIIPTFTSIFTQAGVALPLPTQIVYNLSQFVKSSPLILICVLGSIVVGFKLLLRIRDFRFLWDRFLLSLPYIGPLTKRIEIARWTRAVGLMLSSGVPILKTLEISGKLTQNLVFEKNYKEAYDSVQSGGKLADTLGHSKVFFNDAIQMISTGENSGTLDKMLYKIAGYYDQLTSRSLKRLTGVIEPFFVVFMGFVVGFIMLSILLPMFDMISVVNKSHG